MTSTHHELRGGCACGIVRYRFLSSKPAGELQPRACQCIFCKPGNAQYVGDSAGRLEVEVTDKRYLYSHSFGTYTADFVHCGRCNHLVYVTTIVDGKIYALVELHGLEEDLEASDPVPMDFDGESVDERLGRRAGTWIPELEIQEHA